MIFNFSHIGINNWLIYEIILLLANIMLINNTEIEGP